MRLRICDHRNHNPTLNLLLLAAEREKNGDSSHHVTTSTDEEGGGGRGEGGEEDNEMNIMLQSMGIASPVTKLSAGGY